jgi:hypothetical protein
MEPQPQPLKPAIDTLEGRITVFLTLVATLVAGAASLGYIKGDPSDIMAQITALAVPLTTLALAAMSIYRLIGSRTTQKLKHMEVSAASPTSEAAQGVLPLSPPANQATIVVQPQQTKGAK